MAFMLALRCCLLMFLNLSNSLSSTAKACTTLIPVICSWTKAFKAATAFLTLIKDLFTLSLKKYVAIIKIGKGARLISDKRQSAENIKSRIDIMESKSEIIGINPFEKI